MPRRGEHTPRKIPGDPLDPYGFPQMVADFCEWMGIKGYSPRTIDGRHQMLSYLTRWLLDRGVDRPSEVTKPMLDRYQRWLFHYRQSNGKPLTFRSQHTRLVPVRAFFKWAAKENRILYNPASELELPKLERRLPKAVLTASEAEQVMAIPDLATPTGLRDRAILETFYSTGIRRTELTNLQVFDLDTERRTLMVRQGKGRKDRLIPIGERALAWNTKYLDDTRERWAPTPDPGWLFLTIDGTPFSPGRLTQLVRRYVTAADLGQTGACHLFRHTMATVMLDGGADLRHIQAMLGHADISTTQIYTHLSVTQLQAIHTATHPAAKNTPHPDPDTTRPIEEAQKHPDPDDDTNSSS
ncbi:MAG: site-specific tyrosine recombinase XerC [bacterium]|nr:site-specific tyrosine recombinase XerC [bacterium]